MWNQQGSYLKVTVCTYSSSKAANNNAPLQSTNGSLVLVIENHSVSIFQNCGCQATMKLTMFSIIPLIILNMSMKPPPWEKTKCTHIKIIYDTAPFLPLIKLVNFIEQTDKMFLSPLQHKMLFGSFLNPIWEHVHYTQTVAAEGWTRNSIIPFPSCRRGSRLQLVAIEGGWQNMDTLIKK